jgi:hypothetical protein
MEGDYSRLIAQIRKRFAVAIRAHFFRWQKRMGGVLYSIANAFEKAIVKNYRAHVEKQLEQCVAFP